MTTNKTTHNGIERFKKELSVYKGTKPFPMMLLCCSKSLKGVKFQKENLFTRHSLAGALQRDLKVEGKESYIRALEKVVRTASCSVFG